MTATRWFVLGFSAEDVIVAWQDARLASQFVRAWRAAGRPADFEVKQTSGDGHHLIHWWVSGPAARVLDAHGVDWRRFVIAEKNVAPPPRATNVLREGREPT